jgi:hypothetical protein
LSRGFFLHHFLFAFLLFLYTILKRNAVSANAAKLSALSSIFLALAFTIIISHEDAKELTTYRKETIGIINKSWLKTYRRRSAVWNVQATYAVNGVRYQTASKDDKDETLMYGDTVTVVYSSRTPEISEIKELLEQYAQ